MKTLSFEKDEIPSLAVKRNAKQHHMRVICDVFPLHKALQKTFSTGWCVSLKNLPPGFVLLFRLQSRFVLAIWFRHPYEVAEADRLLKRRVVVRRDRREGDHHLLAAVLWVALVAMRS